MDDDTNNTSPRTARVQSATFTNLVNAEIRRAATTGIYDIRGGGAKRTILTICCFLAHRYPAIRWKAIERLAAPTSRLAHALPKSRFI